MKNLAFLGRALRHPNYRLFFAGQCISLLGTWLQMMALPWLVYRLTSSVFLLGLIGFLSQIPVIFITPFAGVFIDRMPRKNILLITQIASMVQAIVLWILLISNHMSIPAILILSLILGIINAIDIPARQSFVVDLVENKDDLGNAIALNSSVVHGARLIGPAIAGVLIGTMGESSCFLLNAISFLAVIASLLRMNIRSKPKVVSSEGVWQGLQEGVKYVTGHVPMRAILILIATVSLTGMPYMVFMPVFARDIFHGTPYTLGLLVGASGLGAFMGAMYLASREGIKGLGRIMAGASALFGLSLIAFAVSKMLWLSWICMVLVGFGMMIQFAGSNTILQTIVEDGKRGRVMSLYTVCLMGMTPIGSLLEGFLAHRLGVPMTIMIGGSICILASLNFARNLPNLRKIMHQHRTAQAARLVDLIPS